MLIGPHAPGNPHNGTESDDTLPKVVVVVRSGATVVVILGVVGAADVAVGVVVVVGASVTSAKEVEGMVDVLFGWVDSVDKSVRNVVVCSVTGDVSDHVGVIVGDATGGGTGGCTTGDRVEATIAVQEYCGVYSNDDVDVHTGNCAGQLSRAQSKPAWQSTKHAVSTGWASSPLLVLLTRHPETRTRTSMIKCRVAKVYGIEQSHQLHPGFIYG